MIAVRKPVVRVQHTVAKILKCRAVKLIASRARDYRNLPAGRAPVLRRKRRGLQTEFLHGVDGHEAVSAAQSSEGWQRSSGSLHQRRVASHAEIRADTIDGEVICVRTLPIHAELA